MGKTAMSIVVCNRGCVFLLRISRTGVIAIRPTVSCFCHPCLERIAPPFYHVEILDPLLFQVN